MTAQQSSPGPVPTAGEPTWLNRYPDPLPHRIEPEFTDMLTMFRSTVSQHPGSTAIAYFDGSLTFADLDARSDAVAENLVANDICPGDRVALYTQNDPGFVIGLVATWKAGCSAVVMNPMYRRREVEYLLDDSGATALICLDSLYTSVVREILSDGLSNVRHVLITAARDHQNRNDSRVLDSTVSIPRLTRLSGLTEPNGDYPLPEWTPQSEDLALLMYTSGTTGRPKGAMISHGGTAFNCQTYRDWVGLTSDDRILGVAPLFHITGLVGHVCASFVTGGTLILNHRFDGDVVMDVIREHRPTFTVGSVTVFNNLSSRSDVSPDDFSSFRMVCSGGAPIAPALNDEIGRRTGLYLHNLYGMTETTGPAIGVPIGVRAPVDPTSGALAVGVPVFNTTVRITDDDGNDRPPGETGEILVSGPQVITAYWNQPEASAERIHGDEISTGDVGFMDGDGWCYLVDRKTDMINSSGYKVWPREVEDVLLSHPSVQEAAVIGVADDYRGETVKAFVALRAGAAETESNLIDFCRNQMAAYKYPRMIEFISELPKSVTGKILRRNLRTYPETTAPAADLDDQK
jgi:long-chain acyl-CoA synthetase